MLFPFLLHPLPAPPAPPATLRIHPLPSLSCLLHLAAEGSTALLLVLLLPQAERRCEQVCGYLSPQLTPEPLTMGWKLAPGDEQLKGGGRERCGSAGGKGSGMPAPPPDFQMDLEVYEEKVNGLLLLGGEALPGPQLCFLTLDGWGLVPRGTASDAKITQGWLLC